jgi:antitoxin component YwqK of YwqJK toxin-antitoxin module
MTSTDEPRRVSFDDCEYADSLELLHDGTPFTGIVEERRRDGSLQSEGGFRNGFPHGTTRILRPDGTVRREQVHVHGLRTSHREWAADGRLVREIVYERGRAVTDRAWDTEGNEIDPYADPPASA